MGNGASVKHICMRNKYKVTDNRLSRICRVLGSYRPEEPDVDTLGLPFRACRIIYCHLSLGDLARCMLVCKEWRSVIDTCVFWRQYLLQHFDFMLADPAPLSPLRCWRYDRSCLRSPDAPRPHHTDRALAFYPFPDYWASRIVVPYSLVPPTGSVDCYHNFIHALFWLKSLRAKLDCYYFAPTVEVCLISWWKPRLPSPVEILQIFNAHISVMHACHQQEPPPRVLSSQEFGLYFTQFCTVNSGVGWDTEFQEWFSLQVGMASLVFACPRDVISPAPCFVITTLAPGWIGGMMYAT